MNLAHPPADPSGTSTPAYSSPHPTDRDSMDSTEPSEASQNQDLEFLEKLALGADLAEAEQILNGDGERRDCLLKAHLATSVSLHEWRSRLRRLAELDSVEKRIHHSLVESFSSPPPLYLPKAALSIANAQVVAVATPPGTRLTHEAGCVTLTAPLSNGQSALSPVALSAGVHAMILKPTSC